MLRRLLTSHNAFSRPAGTTATHSQSNSLSFLFTIRRRQRRHISAKSAYEKLANPPPPILSRYPLLHQTFQVLKYTTAGLLLTHIFVDYFYAVHGTWGISMVPTLAASGDRVLISKYYRHGRGLKVGDIVSFAHPLREDMRASKRVIGMPGDFVLRDTPEKGEGMMIQVPEGHCWVVGDNLNHSRDSRMFGPIPLGLVKGKVVGIFRGWALWPESVPEALVDSTYTCDIE